MLSDDLLILLFYTEMIFDKARKTKIYISEIVSSSARVWVYCKQKLTGS
jgi:hypothetical protein